jgi:hypothetical protein
MTGEDFRLNNQERSQLATILIEYATEETASFPEYIPTLSGHV